jgi:ECF sigma factor
LKRRTAADRRSHASGTAASNREFHIPASNLAAVSPPEELLLSDAPSDQFVTVDLDKAELVRSRYFAGFSVADAEAAVGASCATDSRYWTCARAWLIPAFEEKMHYSRIGEARGWSTTLI